MLSTLAAASAFMPTQASSIAPEIDWLMSFINWVCLFFTALIFIGTGWLAWRFRHKPGVNDMGRGPTHSNLLEIVWSVIPLIIVLLIAIWGFQGYVKLAGLPPANDSDTLEINVEAYKWGWRFQYPNGHYEPQLHVPVGMKIRLIESSDDVIHSLYLPQMRIKKDAVPGRFNKQWFTATEVSPIGKDLSRPTKINGVDTFEDLNWAEPSSFVVDDEKVAKGTDAEKAQQKEIAASGFDIYCTEYCGTRHSKMLSKVHVHPDFASYKAWLAAVSDPRRAGPDGKLPSAASVGAKLVKNNGCYACHSVDGSAGTGPSWKNLFNHNGKFTTGESYVADENYIRESILYPAKHLVAGYGPAMPSYLGKFSDRDLADIISYMKSISPDTFKGSPTEFTAPSPALSEDKSKTK